MSIVEYNIRTIIFHIVIILGALWILMDGILATKTKALKITLIIVTLIILFTLIFSLFAQMSYHDNVSVSGKIIDVSHTGSFAGLLDSFSIRVEASDDSIAWYSTSIFSSSSFKKSVQQLEIGDNVNLYTNNFFNLFYKYEKIDIG